MKNLKHADSASKWEFDAERLEYSIEALALSVQFALQKSMNDHAISQKELAARLGVSPARVCQYLAKDAANLTLKTIGRIADALGEEFELFSLADINEMKLKARKSEINRFCNVISIVTPSARVRWRDCSAANDRFNPVDLVGHNPHYSSAVGQ